MACSVAQLNRSNDRSSSSDKDSWSTSTWIRGILNSSKQVSDFSELSPSRSQSSLTLGMNTWAVVQWVFITEE